MTRKKWFQLVWPLTVLLLFTTGAISQSEETKYAYFFELDKYVKVEVSTQRTIAHRSLYDYEEIASLLPVSIKWGGPPGLVQYDRNTHRLYFGSAQPETYSDAKHKERILIVELPDFKLVGRIDFNRFVDQAIYTLLTPDSERLFVSYDLSNLSGDEKNYVFVREVYDTRSYKLLATKKAVVPRDQWTPETRLGIYFSKNVRFSEDGQTIIDDDTGSMYPQAFSGYEYAIIGDQVSKRQKPDWPSAVKEFMTKNPNFTPVWSSRSPARVLLFEVKHYTTIEQLKDETGEFRPTPVPRQSFTANHIIYYDVAAGGQVREFTIKELAGSDPRVLCVTPDGRTAYLAKTTEKMERELYAVDLLLGKAMKIELFGVTPEKCIFSDR